ncbi:MAG: hypothetical protein HRU20_21595 [Pseudomonadales bacterium]|nr:hypothetical protein [Pseudomonadales bacterium]
MSNQSELSNGVVIDVIRWVLDPSAVYSAIGQIGVLPTIGLILIPLFSAIRLMMDGSNIISVKAAVAKGVEDTSKTVLQLLIYSIFGLSFFGLIFLLRDLFQGFGSVDMLEGAMVDLRVELMSQPEQERDWIETLLGYASDLGNAIGMPIFYLAYQVISLFYVFVKELAGFLFALCFALLFVLGYVLIPTVSLGEKYDFTEGLKKTFVALCLWAVIEPILMGFLYIVSIPARASIIEAYGGSLGDSTLGTTGMMVWCIYTSLQLIIMILVLVITPFLALKLASKEGMTVGFAAGLAGTAALAANAAIERIQGQGQGKGQGQGQGQGFAPDMEGDRWRDQIAQKIGDVGGGDILSPLKNAVSGLGDIVSSGLRPSSETVNSSSSDMPNNNATELNSHSSDTSMGDTHSGMDAPQAGSNNSGMDAPQAGGQESSLEGMTGEHSTPEPPSFVTDEIPLDAYSDYQTSSDDGLGDISNDFDGNSNR